MVTRKSGARNEPQERPRKAMTAAELLRESETRCRTLAQEITRVELHSKFINDLDLALSEISGEEESVRLMTDRLGEYLAVSRCFLCEIDPDAIFVRRSWRGWDRSEPNAVNAARINDYITPEFREAIKKGESTIVDDVTTDPRTCDFAANYEPFKVRAFVSVPIPSEGRSAAFLTATQSKPRHWQPDESRLMHDVAMRLWLAIKRARALEELRESEGRARRTLAEQMLAGIAECDASGRFRMVNQRYCDITGRTQSELLEMRISDVTHPEDWPHNAELYQRLFQFSESFFVEKRYRMKDGGEVWVNSHVSPVRNAMGIVEESVSVVIDVTARKRVERELAAAKDRLAADLDVMTNLQRISATFVREGGARALAEIVDAAIAITRASRGEMRLFEGMSGKFTTVAHHGLEPAFLDFWNTEQSRGPYSTALKRGERLIVEDVIRSPIFQAEPELDVMRQAGVSALQATPVLSRSGKLLAVLITYYSIPGSPDERALPPLDLLVQQAADIIERTQADANLRLAYEQAEAATRTKDEFLAVVSHELRSPLTSILGYAGLLHSEALDRSQIKHCVEVIQRNGKAQLQLIEDLLDTARITSGKFRLEVQPLDLIGVINAALDVVRPTAQAKDIELRRHLDPLAGQITGDPDRLQQVVWNLLSNAIKFTPNGGQVDITLERMDPYVQIVVRDTGKGIEPEFLPHVFERFRQSDMSSTRRIGGLGLGLSLVKHVVELHGGKVDAKSEGRGAIFTIQLPLRAVYTAPSKRGRTTTRLRNKAHSLTGVRALIVDDEIEVRTLLVLTLESCGAKAEAVSSGKEALEVLDRQKPHEQFDLLISDIGMPDEDGYTLMRKIRALPRKSGGAIPAIALTAFGSIEHRLRALEAGFQTYAVKPVDPDDLIVAIQSMMKELDRKPA